jgi:hypothetical protein
MKVIRIVLLSLTLIFGMSLSLTGCNKPAEPEAETPKGDTQRKKLD